MSFLHCERQKGVVVRRPGKNGGARCIKKGVGEGHLRAVGHDLIA